MKALCMAALVGTSAMCFAGVNVELLTREQEAIYAQLAKLQWKDSLTSADRKLVSENLRNDESNALAEMALTVAIVADAERLPDLLREDVGPARSKARLMANAITAGFSHGEPPLESLQKLAATQSLATCPPSCAPVDSVKRIATIDTIRRQRDGQDAEVLFAGALDTYERLLVEYGKRSQEKAVTDLVETISNVESADANGYALVQVLETYPGALDPVLGRLKERKAFPGPGGQLLVTYLQSQAPVFVANEKKSVEKAIPEIPAPDEKMTEGLEELKKRVTSVTRN